MKKTYELSEISEIAKELSQKIVNGGLLAFYGDLGTGKTTLTKAISENIGIPNLKIKSPTYTFIRRYPEAKFYHIDLYRLDKIDDLLLQEIEEITGDSENMVIIEWADRMEEYLPKKTSKIYLKYLDEESREIEF